MRVGVLGAGVSGLSIGQMLKGKFQVELLERNGVHGGIARTKISGGIAYHMTGGHCFNSKYPEVLRFVFDNILPEGQWNKVERNAVIRFRDHEISYPIEFAVKEIFEFDKSLAINIAKDLLNADDDGHYLHLEEWFRKKFGNTLTDEYFLPYNEKIWGRKPCEMDPSWVEGKLPIPNKESFFEGLVGMSKDKMPHAEFYYPRSNDQNTFLDGLASGLNIRTGYEVDKIERVGESWLINGELEYDILISTLPLNAIALLIRDTPGEILDAGAKLKYNKVSNVLWETAETDRTWTYIPGSDSMFHRYIHIGSFFTPKQNYTITEVIGERTYEEMVNDGMKDPFLIRPVDHHISDHAYVVFDENYERCTRKVKEYLERSGVYTLGRFGEWQYYNMDICIKSGLDLSGKIIERYNSF